MLSRTLAVEKQRDRCRVAANHIIAASNPISLSTTIRWYSSLNPDTDKLPKLRTVTTVRFPKLYLQLPFRWLRWPLPLSATSKASCRVLCIDILECSTRRYSLVASYRPSPLLCTNYLQSPRKCPWICSVLKISAKVKFPDGNSYAERHYSSRSIFRSALFICLFGICLVLPSKRRNADSFEKCLLFHGTTTEIWDSDISHPMFFIASTDSGIKAVLYSHF